METELYIVDLYHSNEKTIHPLIAWWSTDDYMKFYDDYYCKYNYNWNTNFLNKKYIRILTMESYSLHKCREGGGLANNLDCTINNKIYPKSVNLFLKDYENLEMYLNSISKNLKRDYFRCFYGEKNREYPGIADKQIVKILLEKYLKSNNITIENIDDKIERCHTYREHNRNLNIGYFKLLEELITNKNVQCDDYINLARYIKTNFTFKEFQIIDYQSDIKEIIELNEKKKGTLSGGLYRKWCESLKTLKTNKIINDQLHCVKWYGVFDFNKLISFCSIWMDGEIACIGFFFSNHNYFRYSVTTFLLISIINELIKTKYVKVLNYMVNNCKGQVDMMKWKQRFGFKESCIAIKKW